MTARLQVLAAFGNFKLNFVLFSIKVLAAKEMVHQGLGAAFVTGSPDIVNKFNQEQILEKLSAPHEIDSSHES